MADFWNPTPIGEGKYARVERETPLAGRTAAGTRNSPGGSVIYRMRIYDTVRENLPLFHDFFRTHLLPVQLRHARLMAGGKPTTGASWPSGNMTTGRHTSA